MIADTLMPYFVGARQHYYIVALLNQQSKPFMASFGTICHSQLHFHRIGPFATVAAKRGATRFHALCLLYL